MHREGRISLTQWVRLQYSLHVEQGVNHHNRVLWITVASQHLHAIFSLAKRNKFRGLTDAVGVLATTLSVKRPAAAFCAAGSPRT
jgi:hypothetical protein